MVVYFYWSHCLWLLFITIGRTALTNCAFFSVVKSPVLYIATESIYCHCYRAESLELGFCCCLLNVLLCLLLQSRISASLSFLARCLFDPTFQPLLHPSATWATELASAYGRTQGCAKLLQSLTAVMAYVKGQSQKNTKQGLPDIKCLIQKRQVKRTLACFYLTWLQLSLDTG